MSGSSLKNNMQDCSKLNLLVGGLVPVTSIDFPGKLSAVIFCQGCPWRCSYCHNQHLQEIAKIGKISWTKVVSFLQNRIGLLDAVVFSGGEPTLQDALKDAVKFVKELGYQTGLHTAGIYPEKLKAVLPWISWVGMDIKAPLGDSHRISGCKSQPHDRNIRKSIEYILKSGVQYEFRTTFFKELLSEEDIGIIREDLKKMGIINYKVQECRIPQPH